GPPGRHHGAGGATDRDRPRRRGLSDGLQGGEAQPLSAPMRAASAPSHREALLVAGADRHGAEHTAGQGGAGGRRGLRIATWNVNSIRSRLDRVAAWTERERPDVLCLQEIKTTDDLFPAARFADLGYHVETFG